MRTAKEWKEKWRLEVLERMDLSRDVSDEEIMETIDRIILEKKKEVYFRIILLYKKIRHASRVSR